MSVKINTLQIENTKRVRAFSATMEGRALTVIGGKNGAGKTSVLDAIAYALGGEKFRPSNIQRDGSESFPEIRIELSNGLIVERSGKNSALKVTDRNGMKGGQRLLDEFVSAFALDLPKFRSATSKDKAATVLRVIGVGDELARIEAEEALVYAERTEAGRVATNAANAAAAMAHYEDAPQSLISISELSEQYRRAVATNAANARARDLVDSIADKGHRKTAEVARIKAEIEEMQSCLSLAEQELAWARTEYLNASAKLDALVDVDVLSIEGAMNTAEQDNAKYRANEARAAAMAEAAKFAAEHANIDKTLSSVRARKAALLDGADLPLPELTVADGELIYKGQPWDCMSGAEQLRVSTAIVRRLNPECGFVLIDKLEEMDTDTMAEFGAWLESEGLQAIATRVSTGEECSIIIEDGTAAE